MNKKEQHQPRTFQIPNSLSESIESSLKAISVELSNAKYIADCVLKTSDFYIQNPEGKTPWNQTWCQVAQLAYFLPLNFLRNKAVFQQARSVDFPALKIAQSDKSIAWLDFGSGLGAASLAWNETIQNQIYSVERSLDAQKVHKDLIQNWNRNPSTDSDSNLTSTQSKNTYRHVWDFTLPEMKNRFLHTTLFSYSLTEMEKIPLWALDSENLVILEPATNEDGRKLLNLRQQLIDQGFFIWAPCFHQNNCPLLKNSNTDWCHDRIHLEMPEWFLEIEKHLPIKNQTLTFSYLLASKFAPPNEIKIDQDHFHLANISAGFSQISAVSLAREKLWRLVGDQLVEKGKTTQMLCRSEEREFLTWLRRHGEAPVFYRGDIVSDEIMSSASNQPGQFKIETRKAVK